MTPEQIVADLNRQLERLTVENKELTDERQRLQEENNRQNAKITALSSFYTDEVKNMEYKVYQRDMALGACAEQMEFLKFQISFMEKSSIASAQASAEATTYLEQSLTDKRRLEYHLGQQTIQLQEQVAKNHLLSAETDAQLREYLDKISELRSTAFMNQLRYNESEKKESVIKTSIKNLSAKSDTLVQARDDLIKHLNRSNKSMRDKNKREKKALHEAATKQSKEIRKLEQQILENDRLLDSLRQDAAEQALLQQQLRSTAQENENLQDRLAFFRAEDQKQQHTISSIKRQLQRLSSDERYKGLQQTVRYKTVEIEKMNEQVQREQHVKDTKIAKLEAILTTNIATIKEKEATIAQLKGALLKKDVPTLDKIRADKVSMTFEVADTVHQNLKGIDSALKARRAVTTVLAFLEAQSSHITHISTCAEEVQSLIRDIIHLVKNTQGPEGIAQLMNDVRQVRDASELLKNPDIRASDQKQQPIYSEIRR
jgi:chromosome segregation ATPase